MSCQDSSDINKTFIIEPPSTGGTSVFSACTTIFTNFLSSCSGNTSVRLSTNNIIFNGNLTGTTISAVTVNSDFYYSGGTLLKTAIVNIISGQTVGVFLSLSGGTLTGPITGTTAQFNTISATTISGFTFYGNGSNLVGINNFYTTGVTFTNNTVFFNRNDTLSAYTLNLSTYAIDTYSTGGTFNNNTKILTLINNTGGTFNVTGFTDNFTTAATYSNGIVYFNRNDSLSAYTLNLSSISGDANTFVTGITNSNNNINLIRNDGVTLTTNINVLSGLTVNGSISATTISATTFYGNGSNLTGIVSQDVYVTGGTYNNINGIATFRNNTGGTFTVSGFITGTSGNDIYVTGGTLSGTTLMLKRNDLININIDLSNLSFSGGTGHCITDFYVTNIHGCSPITFYDNLILLSGVTGTTAQFNTISATTFISLINNFNNISANTITASTLQSNLISGTSITAITYFNLPQDITITGGTYSNGTATFRNNSGGTFSVNGFLTAGTDTYVTAYTYSNNVLTLKQNQGQTDLNVLINVMTGLTINGTLIGNILSATTISAGTIQSSSLTINRIPYATTNGLLIDSTNLTFDGTNLKIGNPLPITTSGYTFFINNSGINVVQTGSSQFNYIRFEEDANNVFFFGRHNSTVGGNYTNTSIPFANTSGFFFGATGTQPAIFEGLPLLFFSPSATTNTALRIDSSGIRIGQVSTINNANTSGYKFQVDGSAWVTGNTLTTNLTATTISASTYFNLPLDINVTGGTYNNATGIVTLINNTGGTFNITGFTTGSTNNSDITITGATFSNNILLFRNNTGGTFNVLVNNLSGLTVNGTLQSNILSATTISASTINGDLTLARIGNSTYSTVQHLMNFGLSSGVSSGGSIVSGAGATINVSAGTGFIKAVDSNISTLYFFDWTGSTGINIPSNTNRYIGISYSAGTPLVIVKAVDSWDVDTEFPLGIVTNENGVLYIINIPWVTSDNMTNIIERFDSLANITRDNRTSGLILSGTGTRNVAVTTGSLMGRMSEFSIAAIDTSISGTFDAYYRDGSGGFTKQSGQTQYDNTKYDDGSGTLASLTLLDFSSRWFYLMTDGSLAMLYGQSQTTSLALGLTDTAPTSVPNRIQNMGMLIGRIIIQQGTNTPARTQTVFTTTFSSNIVQSASDLSNGVTGSGAIVLANGPTVSTMTATTFQSNALSATSITGITFIGNGSQLTNIPDTYITGVTVNNINRTYNLITNSGGTVTFNGLTDISITGGTYSDTNKTLSLINNTGQTINITGFIDKFTTGTTLINNSIFFNRNDSLSAYTLNLPLDITVTGVTFNNNILLLTNNTGGTINVLINTLSGLTVNGTLTSNTISATTMSADTIYFKNLSATTVTANTINSNLISGTSITATTFFGNGSNLTGIVDSYITGITFSSNILTLTNNTGRTNTTLINNLSGLTVNGNLSVTQTSNLNNITATGITSNTLSATSITGITFIGNGSNITNIVDTYLTGGTFSNNNLNLINNTGRTISVLINSMTGLTATSITAVTAVITTAYTSILSATSITATNINNITVTKPVNAATLTLANNSSLITSGAFSITLSATNTTAVTLPTKGNLVNMGQLIAFKMGNTIY